MTFTVPAVVKETLEHRSALLKTSQFPERGREWAAHLEAIANAPAVSDRFILGMATVCSQSAHRLLDPSSFRKTFGRVRFSKATCPMGMCT